MSVGTFEQAQQRHTWFADSFLYFTHAAMLTNLLHQQNCEAHSAIKGEPLKDALFHQQQLTRYKDAYFLSKSLSYMRNAYQ